MTIAFQKNNTLFHYQVFQMENNRYQLYSFGEEKGFVRSAVLKGSRLPLEKIFLPSEND